MSVDLPAVLTDLAVHRPVFHSEADLQHALAWQVHTGHPRARIRLEPRPRRGVRLDLLVVLDGHRTAIEIKYLVAGFCGDVAGERFDLPDQSAQDIARHDVVKDLVRVERLLVDDYADHGLVLAVSNDPSYWRPPRRADTIDAAFRIHEGRTLQGTLTWGARAGAGTTRGRDTPLELTGAYTCTWRRYAQTVAVGGRLVEWRYLLLSTTAAAARRRPDPAAATVVDADTTIPPQTTRSGGATAREEILAAARDLARRSRDGSFTLEQILTELRRRASRYSESTIRTHVTSRMCADSPDHHATTFADLSRVDRGVYRLRASPPAGPAHPAPPPQAHP